MNIRQRLLSGYSRAGADSIASYIDGDVERFTALLDICFRADEKTAGRAASVLSVCAEKWPRLASGHLPKLVEQVAIDETPDAVKRGLMRLLQFVEIPPGLAGGVFSICINLIDNPHESAAVRALAVGVGSKIAACSSELTCELRLVVGRHLANAAPSFLSRARRLQKV